MLDETLSAPKPRSPHAGRVVAVVVTHNRLAHLQRCVGGLLSAAAKHLAKVVVVDNASEDGTAEWLSGHEDGRLSWLTSQENLGGAGGFAQGISHALDAFDPDWILLLDDDAYPEADALAGFHRTERSTHQVVCASVFHPNDQVSALNRPFWDPFRTKSRFVRACFQGKAGYYVSDQKMRGTDQLPVDFATFVGFFVSKEALLTVGLPDPLFFLYCDDLEYCLRLRRAGFQLVLDPSLKFLHDCGTFPTGRRVYDPLWKSYYAHRNGLWIVGQTAGWLKVPASLGLCAVWVWRALFYRNRRDYLTLLWWAIKDAANRNKSRPHKDILRRAAWESGWKSTISARPIVAKIKLLKATKKGV